MSSTIDPAAVIPQAKPSSFLKPTILSWINTPYYDVPASVKTKVEQPTTKVADVEAETNQEFDAAPPQLLTERTATEAPTVIEGFDVSKLAPTMLEVACESHISHVQKVLAFFQKGGESAKTFGKIFLNDLALQRTVLNALMNEPGNPLSQMEFLHKELALRLAASSQARQVAQLILADV